MAEEVTFKIGGTDYAVPPLNFADLEQSQEYIVALGPDINWIAYSSHVLHIVANKLKLDYATLLPTVDECSELVVSMSKLLRASGFKIPEAVEDKDSGEATPNLGTGTSTS